VLSATVWCVYCSLCWVRLYGVCTVRCVECDCMVCVLFAVLSATVWCVYCLVCWVRLYGVCTVRCVECDCMVCVLFAVLSATRTQHSEQCPYHTFIDIKMHGTTVTKILYVYSSVKKPTELTYLDSSSAKKANRTPPLRNLHTIITFRSLITTNVITYMYGKRNCHSSLCRCLWCSLYH